MRWISILIVLLVAMPTAGARPEGCQAPDETHLPACRTAATDAALAAMADRGWDGPAVVEAYASLGRDPHALVGAFSIPAADPDDPKHGLRALAAAARTGYDPTAYPDPEWGPLNLRSLLILRDPVAQESDDDSVVSFTILGLHGAGLTARAEALAPHLRSLQGQDGGWRCDVSLPSPDCTGFAVQALAAVGGLDNETAAAAVDFVQGLRNEDGGYGLDADRPESNGDSTAWALTTLQLADVPTSLAAWHYLLGLQGADGAFSWRPAEPASQSTTAAAVVALAGGAPGPAYGFLRVHVPETAPAGLRTVLDIPSADRATWVLDGQVRNGTQVLWLMEGDLEGRVEGWRGERVHRQAFTVHVETTETDQGAPSPLLVPLAALAAALLAARRRPAPPE